MAYLIAIGTAIGIAVIALLIAIRINGPWVLDSVDRLTGGSRDIQLLERATFGENPAQKLDVYAARGVGDNQNLPVLIFFHGGGWHSGDPQDYGFVARAFSPEGFITVNAGYRLHPQGKYPAMLEDTAAAIAWTHRNIARFGGDPNRIILAGHSAGAYNAVMVALDPQFLAQHGLDKHMIAGVIGMAGPYDFYPFTRDSARNAFGHVPDSKITQPVNFTRSDAPPMLLLHGERDQIVRPRNSRALQGRLQAAGADVDAQYFADMNHNDLIIALASPWRSGRPILRQMVNFALSAKASVPVQDETG